MTAKTRLAAAMMAFCGLVLPAEAGDLAPSFDVGRHADRLELRGSIAFYDSGPFTSQTASAAVINGELFFPSPALLDAIGSPRLYIGTDIVTDGDLTNVAYAGLNWQAHLYSKLYLGFSVGGSINDDSTIVGNDGELKDLGSNVLFHLQASAGYDITQDLSAEIYLNHFSNANLGDSNDGLESTGVRLGYRF